MIGDAGNMPAPDLSPSSMSSGQASSAGPCPVRPHEVPAVRARVAGRGLTDQGVTVRQRMLRSTDAGEASGCGSGLCSGWGEEGGQRL